VINMRWKIIQENSKKQPNGAYTPPPSKPVPMPEIKPACKINIKLICAPDNTWEMSLGETYLCNASSHEEMMNKLSKLLKILD